jgi:hypothetical protein
MPILQEGTPRAASAHDQADRDAQSRRTSGFIRMRSDEAASTDPGDFQDRGSRPFVQ